MKLRGQRWELADAGHGTPGGLIQRIIMCGSIHLEIAERTVRLNGDAKHGDARLPQWGPRFFRNEWNPLAVDFAKDARDVRSEVNALGVRKHFVTCAEIAAAATAVADTSRRRPTAAAGGIPHGLLNEIACGLGSTVEVRP